MAKKTGGEHAPRDKPKKRPKKHKKSLSKSEKRNNKNKKYKGQGKGWQLSFDILYIRHERNKGEKNEKRQRTYGGT